MIQKKQKIVLTGGPSTGKTSLISALKRKDFSCLPEISRQVTLEARKQGIEQLFLEDPLLFSKKLLEGRIKQFEEAEEEKGKTVFLDRGIPDVLAYMDYIGGSYPKIFEEACKKYTYDKIFLLPPWEDIYESDNERYENFEQAIQIHNHLEAAYKRFGYQLLEVPKSDLESRANFIIKNIDQ